MFKNQRFGASNGIGVRTWAGWRLHRAIWACALLLWAATAPGQVRQIQPGNALDANPMVGGGGYNTARPVASGINGNLIISGNVTAGRSFQGFSPIGDPSSLQTSIPSAGLSNFVRDSVGLPGIQTGLSPYTPRPYFDLPKTAVSSGAIEAGALLSRDQTGTYGRGAGKYLMPASPLGSTQQISSYAGQLPYATPGWAPAGVGMFNPDIVAGTRSQIGPYPPSQAALSGPLAAPTAGMSPSELAVKPGNQMQQLEAAQQPRATALAGELPSGDLAQPMTQQLLARPPATASQPAVGFLDTGQATSSLLTQMQQYAATLKQSVTAGPEQLQQQLTVRTPQSPDLSVQAAARRPTDDLLALRAGTPDAQRRQMETDAVRQHAAALVEARLRGPIRSLAGNRQTEVDRLLGLAEEQLRKGEYYKAAETYNGILTAAPDNALGWLGRSNALLAAGEYIQAYLALERGISRFPQMLNFDLDLPSLVGNPEILDVRRAELEKMLATRPDYRIQFLLGYMAYFSGVQDVGLQTIQQAAGAAPAGSIVQEAYEILSQRGAASQPAR